VGRGCCLKLYCWIHDCVIAEHGQQGPTSTVDIVAWNAAYFDPGAVCLYSRNAMAGTALGPLIPRVTCPEVFPPRAIVLRFCCLLWF
jgi:hypothetical protein